MTSIEDVVSLMLGYLRSLDCDDEAAQDAAYAAWMAASVERQGKRLVAVGDASGVTAVDPDWVLEAEAAQMYRAARGEVGNLLAGLVEHNEYHTTYLEMADYDASMDAASYRQ
jgi:hypothetical protein